MFRPSLAVRTAVVLEVVLFILVKTYDFKRIGVQRAASDYHQLAAAEYLHGSTLKAYRAGCGGLPKRCQVVGYIKKVYVQTHRFGKAMNSNSVISCHNPCYPFGPFGTSSCCSYTRRGKVAEMSARQLSRLTKAKGLDPLLGGDLNVESEESEGPEEDSEEEESSTFVVTASVRLEQQW